MTLGWVLVLAAQIVRWGLSYAPEDLPPSGVKRLFDAVARGDTLALHRFMASGGDLDTVRDWACRGVYHVATASGQKDLIRWLLRRWGFLHDVAMIGGSPLYFASHELRDPEMTRFWTAVYLDQSLHALGELLPAAAFGGDLVQVRAIVEAGVKEGDPDVLLWAVAGGNPEIVAGLLQREWTLPPVESPQAVSLLLEAVRGGHGAMVRFLKSRWGRLPPVPEYGWTVLHEAAARGDSEMLEALLPYASTPDPVYRCGETPLLLALKKGHREAARVLLRAGASLMPGSSSDLPPPGGQPCETLTAMHAAVYSRDTVVMQWVAERWPQAYRALTSSMRTPLHTAARIGWTEGVRFFIRKGLDPWAVDVRNRTPFDLALEEERREVVRFYLDSLGADPLRVLEAWTEKLYRQVVLYPWKGRIPTLLGNGVPVGEVPVETVRTRAQAILREIVARSERRFKGRVPDSAARVLFQAYAFLGDVKALRPLIQEVGPDDRCGALHLAAVSGSVEAVNLVAAGCDPGKVFQTVVRLGTPAMIRTVGQRFPEVVAQRDPQMLFRALGNPFSGAVAALLDLGWSANTLHPRSKASPLYVAAMRCRVEDLRALLEHGAGVNRGPPGLTPLHGAATRGCLEGVRLLLEHGADPSLRDPLGATPLHRALMNFRWRVALVLLRHGSPRDVRDAAGLTACDRIRMAYGCMRRILRPYCEGVRE